MELQSTGFLDSRLEVYRHNQDLIPPVTGLVVPEAVGSIDEYQTTILGKMYHDISPHDPEGILQYEWLNSRGAIARFERNTIEVRVIDTQETPILDLAIAQAVVGVIQALVEERWCSFEHQLHWPTEPLAELLLKAAHEGEKCPIEDPHYLRLFGLPDSNPLCARHLWNQLLTALGTPMEESPLAVIQKEGCLAGRILSSVGPKTKRDRIRQVYHHLCDCLAGGYPFEIGSCYDFIG